MSELHERVKTFLAGAGGDVRRAVNADRPDALDADAVVFARDNRGRQQRRANAPALNIEIVPRPGGPPRSVGIGWQERDVVVDLKCTAKRKAPAAGEEQLDLVADVARILERRYHGRTRLDLADPGTAKFRYSLAELVEIDDVPESSELARSIVRVAFTFAEPIEGVA